MSQLYLNIKENSIRKKRGISFFDNNKHKEITIENENEIVKMMNYSIANRNDVGLEPGTSTKINSAAQIMKKGLRSPSSTMPKQVG
jgi:hypothetical protein